MLLSKKPQSSFEYVDVKKVQDAVPLAQALNKAPISILSSSILSSENWILQPADVMSLLAKLKRRGNTLEDCTTRIFQGLKTSADKIYVLDMRSETPTSYIAWSPQLSREVELERELCHRLIKGTEMRPYVPLNDKRIILFPYVKDGLSTQLIEEQRLKVDFPKTYDYLKANESYLRQREDGKIQSNRWYGYGRSQALDVMPLPKLITADLAPHSSFLVDDTGDLFLLGGAAGGYGILPKEEVNPLYLAGILNSSTLNFFITACGQQMESGYYSFEARFIRKAPVHMIDFSVLSDKNRHDQLVILVEQISTLYKRLKEIRMPRDKTMLQQQIDITNQHIDKLVYDLYSLTQDEINLVEQYSSFSRKQ